MVTSGNGKINPVDSFTYLGSIIGEDSGTNGDVEKSHTQGSVFFLTKKFPGTRK